MTRTSFATFVFNWIDDRISGWEIADLTDQRWQPWVGHWRGQGQGKFPTIDAFLYQEELIIEEVFGHDFVKYEQRTWQLGLGDPLDHPLHWELGFLNFTENGLVEITNSQNAARVEVLRGHLEQEKSPPSLELESVLLGHDPRMMRTRRRFELQGDEMSYRVWMATTAHASLTLHLEAHLKRQKR